VYAAGVIKGVDEINAVLDEHITMTQAMQFSAFKVCIHPPTLPTHHNMRPAIAHTPPPTRR
jgi:hypothetical protein